MNRYILCGTVILGTLIRFCHADTNVSLVNNTTSEVTLKTDAGGSPYRPGFTKFKPGEYGRILSLNRDRGVTNGKTFLFRTDVGGSDLPAGDNAIALMIQLKGKFIGSDAKIGLATTRNSRPQNWSGNEVRKTYSSGDKTYMVTGNWKLTAGDTFQDVTFTINEVAAATPPSHLRVLQYNIQQRPSSEGLQHQTIGIHSERSSLSTIELPAAIARFSADVVTVNEAFTASLRPQLKKNMANNGYTHSTKVLNANTSSAWSGGVIIFSRYPIVVHKDYEFQSYAGADRNAGKGVQYAKIDKSGRPYHIFASHTNASYEFNGRVPLNDDGRKARAGQFKEVRDFIAAQKIPTKEPVIVVGDLNVDRLSEEGKPGDEYSGMLTTLNVVMPRLASDSAKYTLDGKANKWASAEDGQQWLDYVFIEKAHRIPKTATCRAIQLKAKGKDLSDHYPLLAEFDFD